MRLIEDMLDLATIEAGNFQLDFDTFDIVPFLERAVDKARERLGEDLTIQVECPPDIGALRADERRLRQVMRHLIANAVQASAADDVLVLGAERDADEVRIWLHDNGAGIAPEDHDAIFAKFESRPFDPGQRGAGLGLTLVRSLIELHGGRFELVSEPGRGTRVICHLPQPATPA
jgi:signal transduction histidine kinase